MIDNLVVVTAGDDRYFLPLAACLRSIHEASSDAEIVVLDCGLTRGQRCLLEQAVPESSVRFERVWEADLGELPAPACGSWATYARLLIGDFTFSGRRVLYVDADAVVLQPLDSLLQIDLGGCSLAAVREMYIPYVSSELGIADWSALGLDADMGYFNVGVMLIDIERWNQLRIKDLAIEYLRAGGRAVQLYDQEALNFAVAGNWAELPVVWNVTRYWYRAERRVGQYRHVLEEARILHFLSEDKPWLPGATVPSNQRTLFFDFLDRAGLSGCRPGR